AIAAAGRVFEVLDQEPEMKDDGTEVLEPGPHSIEFENVYYQYPTNATMVLKDINVSIPAGKMIALVGLSGSGKSTMANMVPRFFDTVSGKIKIDGRPIQEYTLQSL